MVESTWGHDTCKYTDVTFICIFSLLLIIHLCLNLRSSCYDKQWNNMILKNCLILCILVHVSCLTYQTLTKPDEQHFDNQQIKYYFFFQLTFDILNIALIAHIFQWIEIDLTLAYVLNLMDTTGDSVIGSFIENRNILEKSNA